MKIGKHVYLGLALSLAVFAGRLCAADDPYLEQYKGKWPQMRYAVCRGWSGSKIHLDNVRNGRYDDGQRIRGIWSSVLVDLSKLEKATFNLTRKNLKRGLLRIPVMHMRMILDFAPGGVLTPEGEVSGLVFAYRAFRNDDEPYDPIFKGMTKSYRLVLVVSTVREALRLSAANDISANGIRMIFYELDIEADTRQRLAEALFREAFDKVTLNGTWYHTVHSSCVSNQFRVLNGVLPAEKRIPEWKSLFGVKLLPNYVTSVPTLVGHTLKRYGLLKNTLKLKCPDEAMAYVADKYGNDAFAGDPLMPK